MSIIYDRDDFLMSMVVDPDKHKCAISGEPLETPFMCWAHVYDQPFCINAKSIAKLIKHNNAIGFLSDLLELMMVGRSVYRRPMSLEKIKAIRALTEFTGARTVENQKK